MRIDILHEMAKARHTGRTPELGPDAKSQVTLAYENGKPVRADSIVVSTQHGEDVSQERVKEIVRGFVDEVMPKGWVNGATKFYVNPTGRFVIGGPDGDAGVTGRKIIVDTYGGAAPHGGGAFSGKDPTKVDRSAAYAARYLAKNIVAAGLADKCTLQLSYAIGVSQPLSLYVDLHGTGSIGRGRAGKGAARRSWISVRAASGNISRSPADLRANRHPTAILAGSPTMTAASPGSGSIWSSRSAQS